VPVKKITEPKKLTLPAVKSKREVPTKPPTNPSPKNLTDSKENKDDDGEFHQVFVDVDEHFKQLNYTFYLMHNCSQLALKEWKQKAEC
jgi:hypothetical protein